MKKKQNLLFVSLLISGLVHVLFIGSAYYLWVPGISGEAPVITKLFHVQGIREMETVRSDPGTDTAAGEMNFVDPSERIKSSVMEQKLEESIQFESERQIELNAAKNIQLEEVKKLTPEHENVDTLIKETAAVHKRDASRSDVTIRVNSTGVSSEALLGSDEAFFIPDDFLESMHAFTPAASKNAAGAGSVLGALESRIRQASDIKSRSGYEALDSFLEVEVLTYRDPEDGQSYFKLSMIPSDAAKSIAPLNKEIIFLVDASLSIHEYRLHAFKEGIKNAIAQLNPGDLFNIYVFKNKIIPFHTQSLAGSPAVIDAAERFLDNLAPDQRTNIYSAFLETIQEKPAVHPSYIVLLSDGNANDGISSTAQLIGNITKTNDRQRPIFSFSGGSRVNHFLLDFLAYPNRGWSEYARLNSEIKERFFDFYAKIKNPILTDIRYQISGTKNTEVFPKDLPDFYRDAVFTIFGKYDEGERFSFRIYGQSGSAKKEFIVSEDFSKMPQGTEEIARAWAFNKVYYLISRLTLEGANPAYQTEIKRLLAKFDLKIPYDIDRLTQQI